MDGEFNSIMEKFAHMRRAVKCVIPEGVEKIHTFEEIMQKEEEVNSNRHEYINSFFEYMEDVFGELYHFVDLTEIKTKLKELEGLLNSGDYEDSQYYDSIADRLRELQGEIKTLCVDRTEGEINMPNMPNAANNINRLKSFTYQVKCFSDKMISEQAKVGGDNVPMSHKKLLYSEKRIQELQSAVYVDRSKQKEEGIRILESDVLLSEKKNYKVTKYKKFLAKNFLQIFYIKEGGIFSNSYFSNCDIEAFSSYKKYNFYKVKLCLSKTESITGIKTHTEYVKTLFNKHMLFYIENPNKKFIKLIICGSGKKQNILKASLKRYLRNDIKYDSLIKISCFTNIYSAVVPSLQKYGLNNHSTNISDTLYNKLISMLIF
jgi:hypothetical protein